MHPETPFRALLVANPASSSLGSSSQLRLDAGAVEPPARRALQLVPMLAILCTPAYVLPRLPPAVASRSHFSLAMPPEEEDWARIEPTPTPPPPPERERDLFIPILVGVSFGGCVHRVKPRVVAGRSHSSLCARYALIILYDVFFGNGLCGLTITCSSSPWG